MITWLASYPRSGNTLYRMILYHVMGIETYSIYNDHDLTGMGAAEAVGHRKMTQSIDAYRESDEMFYVKTHGPPIDDSRAVYIVRDVRGAMISYAHYLQDIDGFKGDFETVLLRLITGNRWGGWSNHVRQWLGRSQTEMVRFEDLVKGEWAGVMVATDGLPDFAQLHARWPQFFRKGKAGSWRDEMPKNLEALCWHHHGKAMEWLGYER